jgi:flagellar biosynthesis GTPase FlhF
MGIDACRAAHARCVAAPPQPRLSICGLFCHRVADQYIQVMGESHMNKNVIIGLVVILLAAGGYYQFSYKPAQEAAMKAEADAKAAADAAAAAAKAAEEEAAAAAKKAEEEAAAAAKAAEEQAAKAAEEAAAAAAKAATDAAAATTEAAGDAAAAATEAAGDAAAAATDAAADAAKVLDPANFDAVKVKALIDASALEEATKTTLKAGVDAAAADTALVPGAIEAVKKALGL